MAPKGWCILPGSGRRHTEFEALLSVPPPRMKEEARLLREYRSLLLLLRLEDHGFALSYHGPASVDLLLLKEWILQVQSQRVLQKVELHRQTVGLHVQKVERHGRRAVLRRQKAVQHKRRVMQQTVFLRQNGRY